MKTAVLFRRGVDNEDEPDFRAAHEFFPVFQQRTSISKDCLVIGRFSVLPFYLELERDLDARGSRLVNTYRQHQFIADMREWCEALGDMTPRLYHRLQDLPDHGPFVVKGQTNSRKHQWSTHMFARDKREAIAVASRLSDDTLIGQQEIYARDYVELRAYLNGLNGMPVTEEYRFFVAGGRVVCGGFYWGSHIAEIEDLYPTTMHPDPKKVPPEFLAEAVRRVGDRAEFYTLDVARVSSKVHRHDGNPCHHEQSSGPMCVNDAHFPSDRWIVVEINDGQMSGLSMCDPRELYSGLKQAYGG